MSATISPGIEERIERLRTTGGYPDTDAVLNAALQLLESRQRDIESLRAKLQIGIDQLDRGESYLLTDELLEEIDREVDERLLRGDVPDPDVCP